MSLREKTKGSFTLFGVKVDQEDFCGIFGNKLCIFYLGFSGGKFIGALIAKI